MKQTKRMRMNKNTTQRKRSQRGGEGEPWYDITGFLNKTSTTDDTQNAQNKEETVKSTDMFSSKLKVFLSGLNPFAVKQQPSVETPKNGGKKSRRRRYKNNL